MNVLERAADIRTRLLTSPQRPPRTAIVPDNIPQAIKDTPRWVNWQWCRNDKGTKWTKRPICATGGMGSSTDSATWSSFETAITTYTQSADIAGVGFVLGDGWAGVDLDSCYDPDWNEPDEIIPIVTSRLASYTEISPSKTGVKILVQGTKPKGRSQSAADAKYDVECYDHGRFFTITGDRWPGTPAEISDRTDELIWFCENYIESRPEPAATHRTRGNLDDIFSASWSAGSDDVERAREALRNIPAKYADTYEDWIKVGNACKTISDSLCDDWIAWSSSSSRFDGDEACRQKWNKLTSQSSLNVGTLVFLAKESGWQPSWAGAKQGPSGPDSAAQPDSAEKPKQQEKPVTVSGVNALEALMNRLHRGIGDVLYDAGDVFKDFECGPRLLTVIGAGPGAGKTTLVMQYVFSALQANESLRAVIANAEMPFDVLLSRELGRRSGVDSRKLRFAQLTSTELGKLQAAASEIEGLVSRIDVMEGPYSLNRLSQVGAGKEPGILVVDYLQKFAPGDDPRVGVNAVMATLRLLASDGWAVIGLSSTSRSKGKGGSSTHDSANLSMASLKESGEIEFNADSLYLLRDAGEVTQGNQKVRNVILDCAKNRMGEKVSLELIFNMPRMRFERQEPEVQRHSEFDEYSEGVYEFGDNPYSSSGVDF